MLQHARMSNTNDNAENLSHAKPIVLLLYPIQIKILASPSTTSFQSSITMSLAVVSPYDNNELRQIENQKIQHSKLFYEMNDDTIAANNISKDTSY